MSEAHNAYLKVQSVIGQFWDERTIHTLKISSAVADYT